MLADSDGYINGTISFPPQESSLDSQFLLYLQASSLHVSLGTTPAGQLGSNLGNGDWHHVTITHDLIGRSLNVRLNSTDYCNMSGLCRSCDVTSCRITLPHSATPTLGPILFGSLTGIVPTLQNRGLFLSLLLPNTSTSFGGCIRNLFVNSEEVFLNLTTEAFTGTDPPLAVPGCPREEQCSPQPCLNGGACFSYWTGYLCECPLDFKGMNCSESEWMCVCVHVVYTFYVYSIYPSMCVYEYN